MKDKVINELLNRISDLEFEVERLEEENKKIINTIKEVNKECNSLFNHLTKKDLNYKSRIDKAIEYINEVLECNYHGANITFDVLIHNTNNILKGVDKE